MALDMVLRLAQSAPIKREGDDMTRQEVRQELNSAMKRYPFTSRSEAVRVETASLIEACYLADHINRDEYFELMGALI